MIYDRYIVLIEHTDIYESLYTFIYHNLFLIFKVKNISENYYIILFNYQMCILCPDGTSNNISRKY